MKRVLSFAIALGCSLFLSGVSVQAISSQHAGTASSPALQDVPKATKGPGVTLAKLPLSFEVNQGQTDPEVKFISRGSGYTLFLTASEAVLTLQKPASPEAETDPARMKGWRHQLERLPKSKALKPAPAPEVLRMKLVGANPGSQAFGQEQMPGKSNYYLGSDPKKWQTNVSQYAKVRYEGIYPGIDLVYYGNQRQLEYDFIVSPGADPEAIRLSIEGTQSLTLDTNGDLVLGTAGGELRLRKPIVYQEVAGIKQNLPGKFLLKGNSQIAFNVVGYDPTKPLTIDPTITYSTYLGGSGDNEGSGIAVDASGNAYVTGSTSSTNFPTTSGAFQTSAKGGTNAYVAKINTGAVGPSSLVYSTYLGGSGFDSGHGIAVDSFGNAYVMGSTTSADFPTTAGAFQTTLSGSNDAFVTKLNPTGTALVYSSYLGGSAGDFGFGITVDGSGNAYVTGETTSNDFPTMNPFQSNHGGGFFDAFITKLNPTGTGLVYSTYLGGVGFDSGLSIAVDSSDNAYVTGSTASTNFPVTSGAFQTILGGSSDAFVIKINPAGSGLVYSTFLGGNGSDEGSGIALDPPGNAYVTGFTASTNFPTMNAFQAAYGGGLFDMFVAKLNAAGSALFFSTYLGGSDDDEGNSIAVDPAGNAYITGFTKSGNFPVVNPLQSALDIGMETSELQPLQQFTCISGKENFVLVWFNFHPTGNPSLGSASCYGGSGPDSGEGGGLFLDPQSQVNVITNVITGSPDLTMVNGAEQVCTGSPYCSAVIRFATGVTVPADPSILFNQQSFDYGSVLDGQTKDFTLNITNPITSTLPLAVNVGTATPPGGPFSVISGGGLFTAQPGNFHPVVIRAAPTGVGTFTGNVAITHNALNFPSPFNIGLTVTGVAPTPIIFFNQQFEDYGSVTDGQTKDFTLNITNPLTATVPLSVSVGPATPPGGPFSVISGGGSSTVLPGNTLPVGIRTAPTILGTVTGNVAITHNAGNVANPFNFGLSVTGVAAPTPIIFFNQQSFDYGSVLDGQTKDFTLNITNPITSTLPLAVNVGTATPPGGPFSVISGGGSSTVLPGNTLPVGIRTAPTILGTVTGNVAITHNAGNVANPFNFGLSVTGVAAPTPIIFFNQQFEDYGSVTDGQTKDFTLNITNPLTATVPLSVSVGPATPPGGPFSVISGGGSSTVLPGNTLPVGIRTAPTILGTVTGNVAITHNAGNAASPFNFGLSVTGVAPPTPIISFNQPSEDFGSVTDGEIKDFTLIITNGGTSTVPLNVNVGPPTGGPFSLKSGGGSSTVQPGNDLHVVVEAAPIVPGIFTGNLPITHNAGNAANPFNFGLSVTGTAPSSSIFFNQPSEDFGSVTDGETKDFTLIITNGATSTGPLNVNVGPPTGAPFSLKSGGGSSTVQPGNDLHVVIEAAPTVPGIFTGNLPITHNAGNAANPFNIGLSVTGTPTAGPDFAVVSFNINTTGDLNPKERVTFTAGVANLGATGMKNGSVLFDIFVSSDTDSIISPTDQLVAKKNISGRSLKPGSNLSFTLTGTLPKNLVTQKYNFKAAIDPNGQTSDSNPGNNINVDPNHQMRRKCPKPKSCGSNRTDCVSNEGNCCEADKNGNEVKKCKISGDLCGCDTP